MSLSPEQLASFDRILSALEAELSESHAFLASPAGRRQMRKFAAFGHAPVAVTLDERDVRMLRSIRDAVSL